MSRFLLILTVFSWISCQKEDISDARKYPEIAEIPEGFPSIEFPADNAYNYDRWVLGKKLFYDPALSRDSSISCASCHKQDLAFADSYAVSPGVNNLTGTRNAPSLANIAYHPYLMREGGVATIEMQVLVPIQEHTEMDFSLPGAAARLKKDASYVMLTKKAYGRNPDPYTITRALAVFERTLLSGNSPYDQYITGRNTNALKPSQLRGKELFFSHKTNCSSCHGGFNFTDYRFANNGLYAAYKDEGRMRLTGKTEDNALFKVPSLRNAGLTAPYMHDGSMATLKEVIGHYNSGGAPHPNKSNLIKPLGLSSQEISDLVAFLESLTDETFINHPDFRR
jgi:cytochrome c peroxidase